MNYIRFNVAVLPLITTFFGSLAVASSAHAASPQGFWCGTLDRELEVKVSMPVITSPGLTSQASFLLINGTDATDGSSGNPASAYLARQDAAQATLTDATVTYQATHVIGFGNGQNFVGPLSIDQIAGFQVQINFNPSIGMVTNSPLGGVLTVVQLDGTQSQAALSCITVE